MLGRLEMFALIVFAVFGADGAFGGIEADEAIGNCGK